MREHPSGEWEENPPKAELAVTPHPFQTQILGGELPLQQLCFQGTSVIVVPSLSSQGKNKKAWAFRAADLQVTEFHPFPGMDPAALQPCAWACMAAAAISSFQQQKIDF